MNKEDVLSKSREENKNGDERERKMRERAFAKSAVWGGFIWLVVAFVEEFVFERDTAALWLVYSGTVFVRVLIEALQVKSKKYTVLAVVFGVLLTLYIVIYLFARIR